jgi:large subunit ribosomal protein L23
MNVYEVLRRPILTEKTDYQREVNQYVFEVDHRANKHEIKAAVEKIFDVKVEAVNTMQMKPKRRRLGRRTIITHEGWKRAVITLAPGERIQEFFEGV